MTDEQIAVVERMRAESKAADRTPKKEPERRANPDQIDVFEEAAE